MKISTDVLYISYDGILEPLGQSQVLSYLKRLATHHSIHLISFEKPADWAAESARVDLQQRIQKAGIHWTPLRYHKSPSLLATLYDIIRGCFTGLRICIRHGVKIVHARSYVPAVIALVLNKILKVKFIFDMRGFWADERVDGGLWKANGRLYRVAKWFEKRFILNADCVVSLTEVAVLEMRQWPYLQDAVPRFEVIPTCADLDLFRPGLTNGGKDQDKTFTLGYVGSVGVWYLFDETLLCFIKLQRRIPQARLHILNRGDHAYIRERLTLHGIPGESVLLESARPVEVARAMQKMDAGIFFYKSTFSKLATSPTKLGEFLGCGIPCLGNRGVGDMAQVLESEQVGVVLDGFSDKELENCVDQLLDLARQSDISSRCRNAAIRHFSLDEGVKSYARIWKELSEGSC